MFNKKNNSKVVVSAPEKEADGFTTIREWKDKEGNTNRARTDEVEESTVIKFDPKMGRSDKEFSEVIDTMSNIGGVLAARRKQMEEVYGQA